MIKNQFSIKDLEVISGIKAHTIRIWEQRYNLLSPSRTDTNIRYYSNDDLKLLLNITFLYNSGYKISRIAGMEPEEIRKKVFELCEFSSEYSSQVNDLTIAMVELDEMKFEKVISRCIIQFGFEKMMEQVIYPFLQKVGIMWVTNNVHPAQEHFISNLVRQKIIVAIDGQTINTDPKAERFILFLPDEEIHEISLLYMNYLLRSRKKQVLYLGISVPLVDLQAIYNYYEPNYLLTIMTSQRPEKEISELLRSYSDSFQDAKILVSGAQLVNYRKPLPKNTQIVKDLNTVHEYLNEKVRL